MNTLCQMPERSVRLLSRRFVEKPWGQSRLPSTFGSPSDKQIGEIWFDDDVDELPLLIKWLFTSEKLSIQVHPDGSMAQRLHQSCGKDEWWYIVDAEPGARLGIGPKTECTSAAIRKAVSDGSIVDLVDWVEARPGDYFFVPAGTIHSIGGGISLVEIQQSCDVTYRLFDFGRPRELDVEMALEAANFQPYDRKLQGKVDAGLACQTLSDSEHFAIHLVQGDHTMTLSNFTWIAPVRGSIALDGVAAPTGHCVYGVPGQELQTPENAQVLLAVAK